MLPVNEQLLALQIRFRKRLSTTLQDFQHSTQTGVIPADMASTLHKLIGTAGTYGYETLSHDLRQIDDKFRNQSITAQTALSESAMALEKALMPRENPE